MVHESPTGGTRVLWVQAEGADTGAAGSAGRLVRALVDADVVVERAGDVYHALASLLTDGIDRCAVFVNVDHLEPEEFEFFSIVARRKEMPPVYVFGAGDAADAMRRAVQLGAAGQATAELIHTVLVQQASGGEAPAPGNSARNVADRDPIVGEAEAVATEPIGEPAPPLDEFLDRGEDPAPDDAADDTGEGAPELRVPWRDYEDHPARQAPTRRSPNDAPDRAQPEEQDDTHHEPLLTQEELRALIGTDGVDGARDDPRGRKDSP